jgi:hypothetical protein
MQGVPVWQRWVKIGRGREWESNHQRNTLQERVETSCYYLRWSREWLVAQRNITLIKRLVNSIPEEKRMKLDLSGKKRPKHITVKAVSGNSGNTVAIAKDVKVQHFRTYSEI